MIIETPLYYKATDLQSERCQVDEVVTLSHWQFEYLKNCTLDDFDFIEKKPIVTVGEATSDLYSFDDEFKTLTVDDELDLDVKPLSEYQKLMRKDSDGKIHNHNIRYPNDIVQDPVN